MTFQIFPNRNKLQLWVTILLKHNTGYIIHPSDFVVTMTTERLYSLPPCISLRAFCSHGNRRLQRRRQRPGKFQTGTGANIEDSEKPRGQRDQTFPKAFETHSVTPAKHLHLSFSVTLWTITDTHTYTHRQTGLSAFFVQNKAEKMEFNWPKNCSLDTRSKKLLQVCECNILEDQPPEVHLAHRALCSLSNRANASSLFSRSCDKQPTRACQRACTHRSRSGAAWRRRQISIWNSKPWLLTRWPQSGTGLWAIFCPVGHGGSLHPTGTRQGNLFVSLSLSLSRCVRSVYVVKACCAAD